MPEKIKLAMLGFVAMRSSIFVRKHLDLPDYPFYEDQKELRNDIKNIRVDLSKGVKRVREERVAQ